MPRVFPLSHFQGPLSKQVHEPVTETDDPSHRIATVGPSHVVPKPQTMSGLESTSVGGQRGQCPQSHFRAMQVQVTSERVTRAVITV
jgi:hypothetical protein